MSNTNPQEYEYFKTLPKFTQESVMQSGVKFNNEQELREFVAGLGREE